MATEHATAILAVDIDGTIREGKDDALGRFVNSAADVRVFPEAVALMRKWKAHGGRIIGVSNQGGIALGILTLEDVTAAMIETARQCDNLFDKLMWCRHHPQADDPEMRYCWCRKPSPGLLIEGALDLAAASHTTRRAEYYPPYMGLFVGDRPEDEEAARLAGFPFMWAADWRATA